MIDEFKAFILRGNVIDLAVGVVIGTAFNAVVKSLVDDIIMPPIGYLLGGVDFSNLFFTVSGKHYPTLAEARAAHAVTVNYGTFINTVISFLIIGASVFVVVKMVNHLWQKRSEGEETDPATKSCPFCVSMIPVAATRCPNCTSELEEGKTVTKAA
ncbi:MAG TPA: large-conductance mechanosensitive channel protein MscL [Candidatus Paceibacterota bacterium]|nr:large-conductance mechanosensitive channel protein MscL [Candidatus Paceibacterota bacterium]